MRIISSKVRNAIDSGEGLRLNLGCGTRAREGFFGVDQLPLPTTDIIANLNEPFSELPDQSVAEVYSRHALEHVDDLLALMAELHRICRPDARIEIIVPHFSNPYAYSDPTHVRQFGLYTFFYFSDEEDQPRRKVPSFYSPQRFRVESTSIRLLKGGKITRPFFLALQWWINRNIEQLDRYERFFCWRFPAESVRYVLRPKHTIAIKRFAAGPCGTRFRRASVLQFE